MLRFARDTAAESVALKAFPVERLSVAVADSVAVKARVRICFGVNAPTKLSVAANALRKDFDAVRNPVKASVALNPASAIRFVVAPVKESVAPDAVNNAF